MKKQWLFDPPASAIHRWLRTAIESVDSGWESTIYSSDSAAEAAEAPCTPSEWAAKNAALCGEVECEDFPSPPGDIPPGGKFTVKMEGAVLQGWYTYHRRGWRRYCRKSALVHAEGQVGPLTEYIGEWVLDWLVSGDIRVMDYDRGYCDRGADPHPEPYSIGEAAVAAGWSLWFGGVKRASQAYILDESQGYPEVKLLEGEARIHATDLLDRRQGPWGHGVSGTRLGSPVHRRAAAKLATWAGWPIGSPQRQRLIDWVAEGHLTSEPPTPRSAAVAEAYAASLNRCSLAVAPIDGYVFTPTSCMEGERQHGETVQDIAGALLQALVWDFPKYGKARALVWKDAEGRQWIEDIFGCPQVYAAGVAEWLRRHKIRPIGEWGGSLDLGPVGEQPYTLGYCDYLRVSRGRWMVDRSRRDYAHPDSTKVVSVVWRSGSWVVVTPYEEPPTVRLIEEFVSPPSATNGLAGHDQFAYARSTEGLLVERCCLARSGRIEYTAFEMEEGEEGFPYDPARRAPRVGRLVGTVTIEPFNGLE